MTESYQKQVSGIEPHNNYHRFDLYEITQYLPSKKKKVKNPSVKADEKVVFERFFVL
jgi:hypothetical protein